jgi:rSAM/selenodomain-associated transferase 1
MLEVPVIRHCIVARVPEPGKTKTRLIPSLGAEGAAALSAAMTQDVLERAKRVAARIPLDCFISLAGNLQDPWVQNLPFPVVPQVEGDLGAKLAAAMQAGVPTIFTGTDSPTLPDDFLVEAAREVQAGKVVFGPAFDGGYALVATADPKIFEGIPWSCAETLYASVKRARMLGYEVSLLPFWYDVDEAGDVGFLKRHIELLGEEVAVWTRRWLGERYR